MISAANHLFLFHQEGEKSNTEKVIVNTYLQKNEMASEKLHNDTGHWGCLGFATFQLVAEKLIGFRSRELS